MFDDCGELSAFYSDFVVFVIAEMLFCIECTDVERDAAILLINLLFTI